MSTSSHTNCSAPSPFHGLLIVIVLLIWTLGCGSEPEALLESPVQWREVVEDIVTSAAPAPDSFYDKSLSKQCAEHLVMRVEVPPRGLLHLDTRISRIDQSTDGEIGPTRFTVDVNGDEIYTVELGKANGNHDTVETDISLERWSGDTVELALRIANSDRDNTRAYWNQATLRQAGSTPRRSAAQGPNVLFVVVDTLRADHCSLYGYSRRTTPFLEELARESLVFENAISQASWTLPAVASLLTGLYPNQHGATGVGALHHRNETIAEVLQKSGLTTAAISSSPVVSPTHGFDQGFETFHHSIWMRAEEINDNFRNWVSNKQPLQWFAYLHYIDPHDPYDAPAPQAGTYKEPGYRGVFRDKASLNKIFFTQNFGKAPSLAYNDKDIEYLKAAYDEEILYWDQQLRELVDVLRQQQILERTFIIIVSDHGEEFTDHNMFKHGSQLYEESVRVPLLIRAPGLVSPGRNTSSVETRLAYRAVLQLLRLSDSKPRPNDLLLTSNDDVWPTFSSIRYPVDPSNFWQRRKMATIRRHPWKLIMQVEGDTHELYHLEEDPQESRNLAVERPKQTTEYVHLLRQWMTASPRHLARTSSEEPPVDPKIIENLRALGYIE